MKSKRKRKPVAPAQLLKRIAGHYERLDEELSRLEDKLQNSEVIKGATIDAQPSRRRRKPR